MSSNVPEWHCIPKLRLQKHISLQLPENYPPAPLRPYDFHDVNPTEYRTKSELVFDPCQNIKQGGPQFSGDFECGNLGCVYLTGVKTYEIHLIPDPNDQRTTQWFFFKVENLEPGDYAFTIVGFYRQCNLHYKGSKACVYSEAAARNGIGWQRIGENLNYFKFKHGKFPEWAFSFTFSVTQRDTMYFAHSYPYTYTDLMNYLSRLPTYAKYSTLCRTDGDISVPAIFWDADQQKSVDIDEFLSKKNRNGHDPPQIRQEHISEFAEDLVELLRQWKNKNHMSSGLNYHYKPVIVIAARTHPGETNSSFAMEGLMNILFGNSPFASELKRSFSWLILPMINPDGVICGFYRPGLCGDDMNRVWGSPNPKTNSVAYSVLDLLEVISKTRPILFFLDFHGHTAACNSFVYGFMNESNPDLYSAEKVFPLLMTRHSNLFSNEMCSFLKQKQYEGTMRVVIRRRFLVLFAYTLEMSYGGCDFGPKRNMQFSPADYRSIGEATARAIGDLLLNPDSFAAKETMLLLPPADLPFGSISRVPARIEIQGAEKQNKPGYFKFSAHDITIAEPHAVRLVLKQMVKDPTSV